MNDDIFQESKEVWEKNLKKFPETLLKYPSENIIRLFSGRYVDVPAPPARILDHGFGHGNNLIYLALKGYDCYGCEISVQCIETARKTAEALELPVNLLEITSDELPFADNFFDIVVSWDVIHYNGTRDKVLKNIEEIHRILKPGGKLLLSTVHPDSSIFDRVTDQGNGTFLIEKSSRYDNRQGLKMFFMKDDYEVNELYSVFSYTDVGKYYYNLFKDEKRHAAFLIYAVK